MKIGCVTMTWGKFRRQNPADWPEERVWREVKEAGFESVTAWPSAGQSPQELRDRLDELGLVPAPGYYGDDFWLPEQRDVQIENARQLARTSQALGLSELFVSPAGWRYVSRASGKERNQIAGRVGPADGLTDAEWAELAVTLNAVGQATLEEGVKICVHNHTAQVVETRAECDRLFNSIDPNLVFWGPDSGHLAFGGVDPAQFFRDYAPHIKAVHLKDVVSSVVLDSIANEWDYGTSQDHGLWTELGQGSIDFPAIFAALRAVNYNGWIMSEIDVTQKPSALQSARECREYLATQGL